MAAEPQTSVTYKIYDPTGSNVLIQGTLYTAAYLYCMMDSTGTLTVGGSKLSSSYSDNRQKFTCNMDMTLYSGLANEPNSHTHNDSYTSMTRMERDESTNSCYIYLVYKSPIKTLKDNIGAAFAPATYDNAIKMSDGSNLKDVLAHLSLYLTKTVEKSITLTSDSNTINIPEVDTSPDWFVITPKSNTASIQNLIYAVYYISSATNCVLSTASTDPSLTFSVSDSGFTLTSTAYKFAAGQYNFVCGSTIL